MINTLTQTLFRIEGRINSMGTGSEGSIHGSPRRAVQIGAREGQSFNRDIDIELARAFEGEALAAAPGKRKRRTTTALRNEVKKLVWPLLLTESLWESEWPKAVVVEKLAMAARSTVAPAMTNADMEDIWKSGSQSAFVQRIREMVTAARGRLVQMAWIEFDRTFCIFEPTKIPSNTSKAKKRRIDEILEESQNPDELSVPLQASTPTSPPGNPVVSPMSPTAPIAQSPVLGQPGSQPESTSVPSTSSSPRSYIGRVMAAASATRHVSGAGNRRLPFFLSPTTTATSETSPPPPVPDGAEATGAPQPPPAQPTPLCNDWTTTEAYVHYRARVVCSAQVPNIDIKFDEQNEPCVLHPNSIPWRFEAWLQSVVRFEKLRLRMQISLTSVV